MNNPAHSATKDNEMKHIFQTDRATHSPLPWRASPSDDEFFEDCNILRPDGLAVAVAVVNGDIAKKEADMNAELIVRAVNHHDALVAMLERVVEYYDCDLSESGMAPHAPCKDARALLAKVKS
jgi:hypothetical protein